MSNFVVLFSDKPLKSNKLKLEEVEGEFAKHIADKTLNKPHLYHYAIHPVAGVDKTEDSERAPEFYRVTCEFFKLINGLSKAALKDGGYLAFLMTYYGQEFEEYEVRKVEFKVDDFLNRYLEFEFNTVYELLL